MELALATHTHPREWWDETDAVIATALDVLEVQARQVKQASKGR